MTQLLQDLVGLAGRGWLLGALVFLRVGAAMALLPGFSERPVPARVRLGIAVAFTLVVAPAAATGTLPEEVTPGFALRALVTETVAGLLLGLSLRLLLVALEMAGTIAAQATSIAQLFPGAAEPMPVISHLLVWAALCLAMAAGLHVRLCELLIASYTVLPVGELPRPRMAMDWGLSHIGAAFALAVQIAAPFVAISFLYNIALGVINRAMPQLMVAFVGAPAIAFGALLLLLIAAPAGLALWLDVLGGRLGDAFGAPG